MIIQFIIPCEDGLTCKDSDGVSQSAMSDQFKEGNDYCTAYLALWTSVVPSYSDGTFTFTWSNGKSSILVVVEEHLLLNIVVVLKWWYYYS